MNRENDIVEDAYYLINLYHKDNKEITQLHVQKIMFLFEAYYMNKFDVEQLYDCQYQAWPFGPVATVLYSAFKKYGKSDIELTDDEIEKGNNIKDEKKNLLENLYDVFKDFSAMQLVNFTHAENSPWDVAWKKKRYSEIPKENMKEWFEQYIVKKV